MAATADALDATHGAVLSVLSAEWPMGSDLLSCWVGCSVSFLFLFVGVFLLTGILMPENSCIVGVCLTFKHTAAPQPGLAGSVTPNSGLFAFESQSHCVAGAMHTFGHTSRTQATANLAIP